MLKLFNRLGRLGARLICLVRLGHDWDQALLVFGDWSGVALECPRCGRLSRGWDTAPRRARLALIARKVRGQKTAVDVVIHCDASQAVATLALLAADVDATADSEWRGNPRVN
jgi:hypothetical protein